MLEIDKKNTKFHHGNLEESLINKGIELISEHGNTNFSLREVSASLGVSHAAAYRHFKSKSELIAKIAMRGFDILTKRLEIVGEQYNSHLNSYKTMMDLGAEYINFGLENPGLYRALFIKEIVDGISMEELDKASLASWQPLINAIKQGQANRKILPNYDAYDIGSMLWAALHGYVMLCLEMDLGGNHNIECVPNLPKQKFLEMVHQSIWK